MNALGTGTRIALLLISLKFGYRFHHCFSNTSFGRDHIKCRAASAPAALVIVIDKILIVLVGVDISM